MPAERKLADEDVVRLRNLHDVDGWPPSALAQVFGISTQHVGRLLRGEQRSLIGPLDAAAVRAGVVDAVEQFLDGARLDHADAALAAVARALAAKLDACAVSDASSAAQAAPRLAAELVAVLERLRDGEPREPDRLDQLRAKRAARRLPAAARNGSEARSW